VVCAAIAVVEHDSWMGECRRSDSRGQSSLTLDRTLCPAPPFPEGTQRIAGHPRTGGGRWSAVLRTAEFLIAQQSAQLQESEAFCVA
jgi:hypothetical protein